MIRIRVRVRLIRARLETWVRVRVKVRLGRTIRGTMDVAVTATLVWPRMRLN